MVFCSTRWRILSWFTASKVAPKHVSKSIRFGLPVKNTYNLRMRKPVKYTEKSDDETNTHTQ